MINPDSHINIQNEFIEIVKREFDGDLTDYKAVLKWLLKKKWIDPFLAKKIVVHRYFSKQLKQNGGNVKESKLDTAIAYDVTSAYVRNIIYYNKKV